MLAKENFESAEERISLSFMLTLCLCAFLYLIPSMSLADDEVGLRGLVNIVCDAEEKSAPIVLIHGTFANAKRAFSSLAPVLKDSGHCLYAINYGRRGIFSFNGTMDINESVKEVSRFVESVLIRTNAEKVSLVGHSQGGLIAFKLAREPELSGRIDRLVAVAPSLYGTTRVPSHVSLAHCPACAQQSDQSSFMKFFHQEKVNPAEIPALILATRQDLVVTPFEKQFVKEPGITNVLLQDVYPDVKASHSGLMHVPEAIKLIHEFFEAPLTVL